MRPGSEALVVTYESRDHALRLLRDLSPLRGRLPVTLFDNASSDGSAPAARRAFPWVRVIRSEENLGYAGALRAALPALERERLWLLNADVRVPRPEVLDRLEGALRRDPLAAAAGPALQEPGGVLGPGGGGADLDLQSALLHFSGLGRLPGYETRALYLAQGALRGAAPRSVEWLAGTAPLLRRDALERAGGVPEGPFLYGEDLLLSRALRRAGYRLLYCPRALVVHVGQGSQAAPDGRWVTSTLALSPPHERRALALCFALGLGLRVALRRARGREHPQAAAGLRAALAAL